MTFKLFFHLVLLQDVLKYEKTCLSILHNFRIGFDWLEKILMVMNFEKFH